MTTTTIDGPLLDFIMGKFGQAEGYICAWLKRAELTTAFAASALESAAAFIERASKTDDVYIAISVNRRGKGPPDRRAKGTPWLVTDRGGSVRPCGASWDCAAGASAVGLGADC